MNPFTECPECGGPLKNYGGEPHNFYFMQICQSRCDLNFAQYFIGSFEGQISHISFYTKHFFIYMFYKHKKYPNMTLAWPRKGRSDFEIPMFKLPNEKVNFFERDKLDEKLHALSVFA